MKSPQHFLILFIALLFLLAYASPAARSGTQTEVLVNGGFEGGLDPWVVLDGAAETTTDHVRNGSSAALLSTGVSVTGRLNQGGTAFPGDWEAVGWVSNPNEQNLLVRMSLEFLDENAIRLGRRG